MCSKQQTSHLEQQTQLIAENKTLKDEYERFTHNNRDQYEALKSQLEEKQAEF